MRDVLIAVALCISVAHADTTIKIRTVTISSNPAQNVQNPGSHTDIHYRQGVMRRKESVGNGATPIIVDIADCDARTGYLIDVNARQYRNYRVVKFWPEEQRSQYLKDNPKAAVQLESLTADTGERKVLFGHATPRGT